MHMQNPKKWLKIAYIKKFKIFLKIKLRHLSLLIPQSNFMPNKLAKRDQHIVEKNNEGKKEKRKKERKKGKKERTRRG